jgi:hypothetical protein
MAFPNALGLTTMISRLISVGRGSGTGGKIHVLSAAAAAAAVPEPALEDFCRSRTTTDTFRQIDSVKDSSFQLTCGPLLLLFGGGFRLNRGEKGDTGPLSPRRVVSTVLKCGVFGCCCCCCCCCCCSSWSLVLDPFSSSSCRWLIFRFCPNNCNDDSAVNNGGSPFFGIWSLFHVDRLRRGDASIVGSWAVSLSSLSKSRRMARPRLRFMTGQQRAKDNKRDKQMKLIARYPTSIARKLHSHSSRPTCELKMDHKTYARDQYE